MFLWRSNSPARFWRYAPQLSSVCRGFTRKSMRKWIKKLKVFRKGRFIAGRFRWDKLTGLKFLPEKRLHPLPGELPTAWFTQKFEMAWADAPRPLSPVARPSDA